MQFTPQLEVLLYKVRSHSVKVFYEDISLQAIEKENIYKSCMYASFMAVPAHASSQLSGLFFEWENVTMLQRPLLKGSY